MQAVRALLFDLGGVLFDIDFRRAFDAWARYSSLSAAEIASAFEFDAAYEQHERGQIPSAEYFQHLASVLRLTATIEQIEEGWNAIFVGEFVETTRLVRTARAKLPCYAFTNTNPSHMAHWPMLYPAVASAFDRIFASHEIGLRKPEPEAFEWICRAVQLPPESLLFFDDLPENVHAADATGLQCVRVRFPRDVAVVLHARGLI